MTTQAQKLRRLITYFRLTDRAFARKVGVSSALVARVAKGDRSSAGPSASISLGAFQNLGVRPEYWTAGADANPADFVLERTPTSDAVDGALSTLPARATKGPFGRDVVLDLDADAALFFSEGVQDRLIVALAGRRAPRAAERVRELQPTQAQIQKWADMNRSADDVRARIVGWWLEQALDVLGIPKAGVKKKSRR